MSDSVSKTTAETGRPELARIVDIDESAASRRPPTPPPPVVETSDTQAGRPVIEQIVDIDESAASRPPPIDENYVNQKRLESLKSGFTARLLNLICEEDFEYGMSTKADVLVKDQMKTNTLATKNWLNAIFVENFGDAHILVGLLRIIARFDYLDVYPEGQTMAVAALSNSKDEVRECGIRAFESWATLDSLRVLENLRVSTGWLQEYVNQVVADLRKEHNVPIGEKNRPD